MDEVPTGPDVLRKRALEEVESRYEEHTASAWRRRLKDAVAAAVALIALVWFVWAARPVPLLSSADFAFHELGHLLASLLPPTGHALAGNIVELGVPLLLALYFARRHSGLHASGTMLVWAGLAARDVSAYIADAPYRRLSLLVGQHDWAFILGPQGFGRMDLSGPLAKVVWGFGLMCIIAGGGLAVFELSRTMRWERDRVAEIERLRSLPRHDPRPKPLPEIDPEATPLDPTLEGPEVPPTTDR